MKYPMVEPALIYKRIPGTDRCRIALVGIGICYDISLAQAHFMRKLNGRRDPYAIKSNLTLEERASFLEWLDDNMLLRDRRFQSIFGSQIITLVLVNNNKRNRKIAKVANRLLLIFFLPMLVLGICLTGIDTGTHIWSVPLAILGLMLGAGVGSILHELGHACACMSDKNGYVFEFGISAEYYLFWSFYAYAYDEKLSLLKKIQVSLAGLEVNIFLTGFFLVVGYGVPGLYAFCFTAAVANILIIAVNSLFIGGRDGMKAISLILFGEKEKYVDIAEIRFDIYELKKVVKTENRILLLLILFAMNCCYIVLILLPVYCIIIYWQALF